MMKKYLAFLTTIALLCSLAACTREQKQPADSSDTTPTAQQTIDYDLFCGHYSDSELVEGPCYTVSIHEIEEDTSAVELSITYVGINTSPIYTTDTIRASIAKDNKVEFEWKDSWDNKGVGTLLLNPADPTAVQLMMTVTDEAEVNRATLSTNGQYKTLMRRETIEVHEKNGILRMEHIQPGLDSYYLNISLRTIGSEKDLCSVGLGNGDWQTGWLDDGFYAISLDKRTAYLYNSSGKCVKEFPLPQDVEAISLAMLNESGNVLLLGKGETAELLLYDLNSQTARYVGPTTGGVRPLTYENGCFYVTRPEMGELMRIEDNAEYATVPYWNSQITHLFPSLGIGKTETNFCICTSDYDGVRYAPYSSVDEIPLAAEGLSFVTVSSLGDSDTLYLYNLGDKTLGTLSVPAQVVSALYTDAGDLLVTSRTDGKYAIKTYSLSQFETKAWDVTTIDRVPPIAEAPENEVVDTPTSSILSVPILSQWPEYPTGCESVSAVMALRYMGENITVARFIDEYLPKSNEFYFENGIKYGPDPYEVFIGSPRTSAAFGCMAPVIEKALQAYFDSSERVVNTSGTSLQELCATYIDKDIPVLVWATILMKEVRPGATWTLPDGSHFTWPRNEHCMVLVGHDENKYYFNDPYKGCVVAYDKALSNSRHEQLGKQSLVILQ